MHSATSHPRRTQPCVGPTRRRNWQTLSTPQNAFSLGLLCLLSTSLLYRLCHHCRSRLSRGHFKTRRLCHSPSHLSLLFLQSHLAFRHPRRRRLLASLIQQLGYLIILLLLLIYLVKIKTLSILL